MSNGHRTMRLVICLVAAGVIAGIGLTLYAQVPVPSTIYACVNSAGNIRIVPGGTACKKAETALEWNGAGMMVFDAESNTIGPLVGITQVLIWIGETRYAVPVTQDGWLLSTSTFFYLDNACATERYVSIGSRPLGDPAPPSNTRRFFPGLTPFLPPVDPSGPMAWTYAGTVVQAPPYISGVVNIWRRFGLTGLCEATMLGSPTMDTWLETVQFIELPNLPTPFTVR